MRAIRIGARAACVTLCLAIAGCDQTVALYTVHKPVPAAVQGIGVYQLEAHINQAASAKGWKVDKIRPGELRATQEWDSRVAVVTILYTAQGYSLRHHSSINLDERDGSISRQYNLRVQQLESEIDKRLKPAAPL